MIEEKKDSLIVIWTSGDREVAEKMVFMYTLNSKLKEWWKEVTLIVWGPSAKLITEDIELQDYLEKLKEALEFKKEVETFEAGFRYSYDTILTTMSF